METHYGAYTYLDTDNVVEKALDGIAVVDMILDYQSNEHDATDLPSHLDVSSETFLQLPNHLL